MHLGVMSKNLGRLAQEIDNMVNALFSRAQIPPAQPMGEKQRDEGNDLPRGAVRSVLRDKVNETINKWNDMLDALYAKEDNNYEKLIRSKGLDLQISLAFQNGKYTTTIIPEIVPRNSIGELALKPYFIGLAGLVGHAVNRSIKNAQGNSAFGIYQKEYLKFTHD